MFVLLLQQEETFKICKKKRKNTPENRSHSSILFPSSFFACFENAQGGHHPGHQSNDRAGRAGEGQVSSALSAPALQAFYNSGDQGDLCHGPGRPQRTDRSSGTASHPKSNLNLWPSTNTCISLCLCFPPYTSFLVGRVPGRKKAQERHLPPSPGARRAHGQHRHLINSKEAGKMAVPFHGDSQQAQCILGKHKETIYSPRRPQWPLPET